MPEEAEKHEDHIAGHARKSSHLYEDWAGFITRNLCAFSFRTRREANFQVNAQARFDGDFLVARFSTSAGSAELDRRRKEISRDGKHAYALYMPFHGDHEVAQLNRATRCAPGSVVMVSMAEPLLHSKLGDNDTDYLFLPREFVDQRSGRMEDRCARTVSTTAGLQKLMADSLATFQQTASDMTADQFASAVRIMGELVIVAMSGHDGVMSGMRSIRAANLARVKRVIRSRLNDPELTLSEIAAACGLSLRYMHALFRDESCSAAEYLRMERLQRAQSLLRNGDPSTTSVTEVALAGGFSNPSQFSTAFRRMFSAVPRDVLRGR